MSPRRVFDPALTEPHLTNVQARSLLDVFDASLGPHLIDAAIDEAGLSREYLNDPERWASVVFHARLADALARRAGLDGRPPYEHPFWQHWRRASWALADARAGTLLWLQIWANERPSVYFAGIERFYRAANQLTRAIFEAQGDGWSRIAVVESTLYPSRPAACWSRRGLLEKIPEVWGLPRAHIDHNRCRHRDAGADRCVYTIHYDEAAAAPPEVALARVASLLRADLPRTIERHQESFREHRRALLTQRKVASYLPANALRALELDPERELALGGQRCDGAVLFADIVGFTRRFADARAEAVVEHLNLYFEHIDPVIEAHGGIIDKRMGDGVMVVFVAVEAERTLASLAATAVRCGLAMLRRLSACNEALLARGGPPLAIRIGVSAGSLIQGNLGSATRMEYTVIGEPVNLAARLQSAASSGRLLTCPECLVDEPALAASGARRRIDAKGIGDVDVIELDPERLTAP